MSAGNEPNEHLEPATHSGAKAHATNNRLFGVTMALIGVLVAFCAAMVGSERNELTKSMIKQTQAHADFTAASTKFRLIMIELEKQHARVATARDPAGGWSPVQRFVELSDDYGHERDFSKRWADSYEPLVNAHFEGAEGYERAQLMAEIGIVTASLAVLLASRAAWCLSLILSGACVVQVARTYLPTEREVKKAEEEIGRTSREYAKLRSVHLGANEDEQAVSQFDPDNKLRGARKTVLDSKEGDSSPEKEQRRSN
ncbi:MAG TPA: DUF4337 family protein [Verrucomicrobiae bacterium]|nr:DUF4337 family protein [Verrucomicrobiae bacterium]